MNMKVFLYSFRSYTLALLVLLIFTSASAPKHEAPRKLKWKERVLLNILQKKIEKQQREALSPKPKKIKWKERVLLNILQKKIEKQHPKKTKDGKRPTHWTNIVALICGILALVTGITAIPALIFGIIGINKSGENKEYAGEGMGIAGVVMGGLVILIVIAAIVILLAIFL